MESQDAKRIKINKFKKNIMILMKNIKKVSTINLLVLIIVSTLLFFVVGNRYSYTEKESLAYESLKDNDIKITFGGDVSPSRYLKEISKKYSHDIFYQDIKEIWQDSDLTLVNVEASVLKEDTSEYTKADKPGNIFLDIEKADIEAMKASGIDLLGYANNHSMDYSIKGMTDSLEIFQELSMDHVGAGYNYMEAVKPYSIEKDGQTISTMAITDIVPRGSGAQKNMTGTNTTGKLQRDYEIGKMVKNSDFSIVYIHWGTEYALKPDKEIQELGRHFIDLGVDLVVGSHPHVLLPIEEYKDGMIVYSLGNLVFDQENGRTRDAAIVSLYLDEGERVLEFVPIDVRNGIPYKTENRRKTDRIIRTLTKKLDKNSYKIEDNKLVLNF